MEKFNMDEKLLEANLFSYEEPKIGPQTSLNVNYLPYFMAYITGKLTRKERCNLIEFEVQTYILELALYQLKYKTLKDLTNALIKEMRMNPKVWILNSEAYNDVQTRLKIFNVLASDINEEQPKVKRAGGKRSLSEILSNSELLRKYVAQLDFDKLDGKNELLKNEKVNDIVKSYRTVEEVTNKQMDAIEKYNEVISRVREIMEQQFKYVPSQQSGIAQQQTQQWDLMTRSRETRQQIKSTQQEVKSHRDIRMILKEQQRLEMEENRTIFVPNCVFKYQKIDIIILSFIYQFILQDPQHNKDTLRIQNLMLFLTLSDQECYKCNKQKKNIYLSDQANNEHKTSQKQFQKYLTNSNDKLMIDFNNYCLQQGVSLAFYFSSTPASYRKELILLRNIIVMTLKFSQVLVPSNVKYQYCPVTLNDLDEEEIESENTQKQTKASVVTYQKWKKHGEQNDYFYLQVLTSLEFYYQIPYEEYEKLIQVYQANIEIVYTTKKDHFNEYFAALQLSKKRLNLIGAFSIPEHIEHAIISYLKYIDAPKTLKKRSYIYHSENRSDWTEDQYKKFLEGLHKFFEIVVNNRRIAKFIEENVENKGIQVNPNHVRFVKGVYLRQLKKRSKEKGVNRKELLKQDIDQFDISIFDRISKKIKSDNTQ